MKSNVYVNLLICVVVALTVGVAAGANIAPACKPAGMFDGGSQPDDVIAKTLNDGIITSFDSCFMYVHNPGYIPINGMGYDIAGSAAVESVVVWQENLIANGLPGRERLKDVRVYYTGGFQDFLNVPDANSVTLDLGGSIDTTYIMVKGLAVTPGGRSDVLDIREIEIFSAGGRTSQVNVLDPNSALLTGAGWSNSILILNDGFLSSVRQNADHHAVMSSGLLSGDTITYNLGSPVAGLRRMGIGQSGITSSGLATIGANDYIETLTLDFATDAAFTNIVSSQSVTLIDELPYQQAVFTPVTAQYVRIGASSIFPASTARSSGVGGATGIVALSEIQLYQASAAPPTTCAEALVGGYGSVADLDQDCHVGLPDFAIFASQWLLCVDPVDVNCDTPWSF